jgi:hypothetical protein
VVVRSYADHTLRTRREESPGALSGFAARGALRIAPASKTRHPAFRVDNNACSPSHTAAHE